MRLRKVTVKNFRSIGAQTRFEIGDLTTLVGPNNEGKSNLLRALSLGMHLIETWSTLMPKQSADEGRSELDGSDMLAAAGATSSSRGFGYSWTEDYPIDKRERRGSHPTVIRLTFGLTPDEVDEFFERTGISNNGELPIEISLSRAEASFGVVKPGPGAANHREKALDIAKFIADKLTFVSIPAVRTMEQARGLLNDLSRIRMREVTTSQEYRQLLEKLTSIRHEAMKNVGQELTTSVRRYLPSVNDIVLEIADAETFDTVRDVRIDDGSVTSLAHKGDGVKSLVTLALIQELAKQRAENHSFILLVDEPEAHLHSSAVHELQVLFEELSQEQQVVLATHNPIFVNRYDERSNVLVKTNTASPARSIAEIREALGVQVYDNLDSAEVVVLVEGLTDVTALQAVLAKEPSQLADVKNGRVVLKAMKGVGKLRAQITREKSTVSRIIAVLDGDDAGDAEAKRLHDLNIIKRDHIFVLRDKSKKHSELEDWFDPAIYLDVLSDEFSRPFTAKHFENKAKKWADNFLDAATTLGVSPLDDKTIDVAKMKVSAAVSRAGVGSLKTSAFESAEALRYLIWPDRKSS